jgi:sugar phosphate isomerase/epimerase
MKLAIQSRLRNCLVNSSFDAIDFAKDLGLGGVELSDERSVTLSQLNLIKQRFETTLIEPVSLLIPCWFSDSSITFDTALQDAMLGLKRAITLGCPRVTLLSQPLVGVSIEQERTTFEQGITLLLPEIRRLGLQATINNSGKHAAYYGQPHYFQETCQALSPHLQFTFDIGNWVLAGESPLKAAQTLAGWIGVVHLKDWLILPEPKSKPRNKFLDLILQNLPWQVQQPLRRL